MKFILRNLFAVLFTCALFSFLLFSFYSYLKTPRFLFDVLKREDYFEKAHVEILKNMSVQIQNDSLKESLKDIITEEKVTSDVTRMVNSLFTDENIKSEIQEETLKELDAKFREVLSGESYDETSFSNLMNGLVSSYMIDLFPYSEFRKLENKTFVIQHTGVMILFSFLMSVLFFMLSILVSAKNSYQVLSRCFFFASVCLICPFCFCHLFHIFSSFYYCNSYFSSFLIHLFYLLITLLATVGVLLFLTGIVLEILEFRSREP